MNIINAENLTKSYTERKLLDKASFYLQEGEKVGVIGINGTGKSTLLKIIAGLEEPDEGQVTCANHIVVRYLPQNPVFDPEMTVLESVLTQCVLNFVGSERSERTDADAHAHAQEQKWSLESDAKSMMTRLGITDFTQKTGELSGGQRKRLALVSVLLKEADILLLDEPTNHLDMSSIAWLETYLLNYRGAVLIVAHDRYFLDKIVTKVIELDNGHAIVYSGNYTAYSEKRAQMRAIQMKAYLNQQQEIKQHSNKVVNINATTQLQVVLVKPERFDDASSIADQLNAKHTVVLNLESASKEVSRRLIDFLSGVAYANNGQIKRVATSTFIITPYNVDIMGDLLDELENNGVFF